MACVSPEVSVLPPVQGTVCAQKELTASTLAAAAVHPIGSRGLMSHISCPLSKEHLAPPCGHPSMLVRAGRGVLEHPSAHTEHGGHLPFGLHKE